jgi:hypothetical protein
MQIKRLLLVRYGRLVLQFNLWHLLAGAYLTCLLDTKARQSLLKLRMAKKPRQRVN